LQLGNEFVWKPTGEINPPDITYACACFHFGGPPGIRKALSLLGMKISSLHSDVFKKIDITKSTSQYAMLQRTCFCLIGVAQQVGAGTGVVPCKALREPAMKYIERREARRAEEKDRQEAEKDAGGTVWKFLLLSLVMVSRFS